MSGFRGSCDLHPDAFFPVRSEDWIAHEDAITHMHKVPGSHTIRVHAASEPVSVELHGWYSEEWVRETFDLLSKAFRSNP